MFLVRGKKNPFNNSGFSKSSLGKKWFKFYLKLIVRIALYHCCPVSCSKRSVATYLLPCDTSLCDHLFIRWNNNVN